MQIRFKEKTMEFDQPLSVFDAAAAAELISRQVIAAHVNGKLCAKGSLSFALIEDQRNK